MEKLLRLAAERAHSYLQGLDRRGVAPSPEAIQRLRAFDVPMPDVPASAETVIELLDSIGSPAAMGSAGGRYFGFVVGGTLPAALAAHWLAGAWDQNAYSSTLAPGAVALEKIALRWLREIFGIPGDSGGAFTTGATMANFAALAAARHQVLARAGWNVEKDGLFGAPPITVVVGAEAHPSLLKALGLLGLGRERVVAVPADGHGRMRADSLPGISGPAIVCIQAGNVNSGAFDPAADICAQAHKQGAWVHVDGAFGLWAAAAPARAHLMAGFSSADSWATDAHKWLNVPYDCGIAFVRDAEALRAAMSMTAAYLPQGGDNEPMDYTPESSRRARGVDVWAALYSLGRSGLADLIERTCRHAARFASSLRDAGYDILNDIVLNQVLVSFGDEEKTRRVIAGVQADGTCWCGRTVWHGKAAMRISVSSWATTDEDVDRSLDAIKRIARREQ
jgi:glutamate/tyrosine decarboxylase-like PLP-dependent enzyme